MKAYIIGGGESALPELISWDFSHGFCSPCDSFEVSFLYEKELLPALTAAAMFRAVHNGKTVFRGVVDEFEISADRSGRVCVLRGRGMQARLLDNQAESAEYTGVTVDTILRRHAEPYGITDADTSGIAKTAADISVSSGDSHWSVIRNFAEFCAGVKPRFNREGRLVFDGRSGGDRIKIDSRTPVSALSYVQDRYGVITRAVVKNRIAATEITVENPELTALGGMCTRIINVPRKTGSDAMRHTGQYQIRASSEEFIKCTLSVPTLFAAFPGDEAELDVQQLGIAGLFLVWSTRCWADGKSAGTVLELVRK